MATTNLEHLQNPNPASIKSIIIGEDPKQTEVVSALEKDDKRCREAKEEIFTVGVIPKEKQNPDDRQEFQSDKLNISNTAAAFEKWLQTEKDYWERALYLKQQAGDHFPLAEENQLEGFRLALDFATGKGNAGKEKLRTALMALSQEQLEFAVSEMDTISERPKQTEERAGAVVTENGEYANYYQARSFVVIDLKEHYGFE